MKLKDAFLATIPSIFGLTSFFLPWLTVYAGETPLVTLNFVGLLLNARIMAIVLLVMVAQSIFSFLAISRKSLKALAFSSVLGILAMIMYVALLYLLASMWPPTMTLKIEVGPAYYLMFVLVTNVIYIAKNR